MYYAFRSSTVQAATRWFMPLATYCVLALAAARLVFRHAHEERLPSSVKIPVALYGFLIAATWIDTLAGMLVDLLQFGGTLSGIPPPILGGTVLAWGNSMGDLSANLALARKGLPDASVSTSVGPYF